MTWKSTAPPDVIRWIEWSSTEQPNGCLMWKRSTMAGGYGQSTYGGNKCNAHRVTWFKLYGVLPNHIHVLHKCDNPGCINPDHLWIGTNYDNVQDRKRKGRPGGRNAKLAQTGRS